MMGRLGWIGNILKIEFVTRDFNLKKKVKSIEDIMFGLQVLYTVIINSLFNWKNLLENGEN